MASESGESRRTRLTAELEQLERQAGISKEVSEKVWDGAFIPYGAMGDEIPEFTSEQNNALYFDNEHDETRRKVRRLYFAVENVELRKELIAKVREMDANLVRIKREWVEETKRDLAAAQQKEGQLPWSQAAITGVVCVFIGYGVGNFFGASMLGAIAGAVVGMFGGQSAIQNGRRERELATAQNQEFVQTAESSLREVLARPTFFNIDEEHSGEEDKTFSRENAFARSVQKFKSEAR